MQEHADLIFANEAFYIAFQTKDLATMEALWTLQGPVACTHPGWPTLSGREQVLQSWRAIFENPEAVTVTCRAPKAYRYGDTGFVTCYESIGENLLAATNIFVRQNGTWKMVHHQAGPCHVPPPELEEEDEAEGRLQ